MRAETRLRLTRRGWGLLIGGLVLALAADLFKHEPLRYCGLVLAAVPVVVYLLGLIFPPRLTITRTVYPSTVSAGDRLRVVVEVQNRSVVPLPAAAYADTITGAQARSVGGVLRAIGSRLHPREGRRRSRIAYGLSELRRGIQTVGPLYLEHIDGLGVTRRVSELGDAQTIEVWPSIRDVAALEIPAQREGAETEVALGHAGEADDVVTREYRRGDAMRRVHWRATARVGELQVRQEEHHRETVARVLLDTAPGGSEAAFELAVSVAASVHTRLHELGYDTEVFTTHPAEDIEGGMLDQIRTPASAALDEVMRRYMLVQPAAADAEALPALPPKQSPVVYVGLVREQPAPAELVDLAAGAGSAVAVLIRPAAKVPLAAREAARFDRAGWRVVGMDASARDPWQVRT